jgi:lipoprotein-releasing system ATP-binding protein
MNEGTPILECRALTKVYRDAEIDIKVLDHIDLSVTDGESLAIIGPSGAGKSTLLHLLGGLDKSSFGQILVDGRDLTLLKEKQRCELRNRCFGFVYQFHHLLPEFTALENVAMPLLVRGDMVGDARLLAAEMLDRVGLEKRRTHKLSQLSGGERQRTAIARALVTQPKLVFADEPTGNLDHHTAEQVFTILLELKRTLKTSLLIVTHDMRLAAKMDRVFQLEDGQLQRISL